MACQNGVSLDESDGMPQFEAIMIIASIQGSAANQGWSATYSILSLASGSFASMPLIRSLASGVTIFVTSLFSAWRGSTQRPSLRESSS